MADMREHIHAPAYVNGQTQEHVHEPRWDEPCKPKGRRSPLDRYLRAWAVMVRLRDIAFGVGR